MSIKFTDEYLKNIDNWLDFGLTDHLESGLFKDWHDIQKEASRIFECEEDSPYDMFIGAVCAASWKAAIKRVAVLTGVDEDALIEVIDLPESYQLRDGCGWDAIALEVEKERIAASK